MEDTRKEIRFIDSRYNELFRIKDGDSIRITLHDGETMIRKCRHIDDTHLRIIGNHSDDYHICEFAGIMERAGNRCEPIPGQEPMLDIIAAEYGDGLRDVTVPMTAGALDELVGGIHGIEKLYGANKDKAYGAILRGKSGIAVCGFHSGGGGDDMLTSLHPYYAQKLKRELSPAERAGPPAGTLSAKIAEARAQADRHNEKQAAAKQNTRRKGAGIE